MAKESMQFIPLKQIENKFDVRVSLDQDRVLQFVGAYESGENPPPIKVVLLDAEDSKYAVVDGRHRMAARAYLNLEEIPAIVVNGNLRDNPLELFAVALEANYGGAKPPTREDITHTIVRMLEHGASQSGVRERLLFLPKSSLRAYIATAISILNKRKIATALGYVAKGYTVTEAAKSVRVKEDLLQDAIKGKTGKWGKNRSDETEYVTAMKSYISRELKSANSGISKRLEGTVKKLDDGEISVEGARSIVKAWSEHLRKTSLRMADWEARINAVAESQGKAIETAPLSFSGIREAGAVQ